MSKYLTTASNELESEIILSHLSQVEINAWESNSLGGRPGSAGPRDIYVDEGDFERARESLSAAQHVDEDELAALAEGPPRTQPTMPKYGDPVEIPIPKRGQWEKVLRRATKPEGGPHQESGDDASPRGT